MKKLLCVILLCGVVLTACGQNNSVSSGASVLGDGVSASTSPQSKSAPDSNGPGAEILAAKQFDPFIQLGGSVLALPAAYGDFVGAGAENIDTTYSDEYLVDAYSKTLVKFELKGTMIAAYVHNETDGRVQMQECFVQGFYVVKGEPQEKDSLIFPGGVHLGMDLAELTAAWGEPTEDASQSHQENMTYLYMEYPFDSKRLETSIYTIGSTMGSATGNSFTVLISRSTSKVVEISRTFTEGRGLDGTYTESKAMNKIPGGEAVQLNYAIPAGFYHNAITQGGKRVYVLEVEGRMYVATIDVPQMPVGTYGKEPLVALTESINMSIKRDIQILLDEENALYVVGYVLQEGVLYAAGGLCSDANTFVDYEGRMISLDGSGEITPAAQEAFETIYNAYILSFNLS